MRPLHLTWSRGVAAAIALSVAGLAACGGGDDASSPGAATAGPASTGGAAGTVDAPEPGGPSDGDATLPAPADTAPPASEPAATVVPEPTTPEITAADILERNPLYVAPPLAPAGCAAVSTVPLDSVDNVRAFYESMMPCLDAAWGQLGGAGIAARPAGLVVFTGASQDACLDGARYSFYCSDNETIYMFADEMIQPWLDFPTDDSHRITRLAAAHTLAHEYGHHVQAFTDIFGAIGADFAGTETERRLELQASCLANVFLAAQADAYPITPELFQQAGLWRYITRVPNHGSEANQAAWTDAGFQTASAGACNTFSAPSDQVT